MPIFGMKVTRLASGGLTDVRRTLVRNTANNCREKSAEAIVDDRNELKKKGYSEVLQIIEGLNLAVG